MRYQSSATLQTSYLRAMNGRIHGQSASGESNSRNSSGGAGSPGQRILHVVRRRRSPVADCRRRLQLRPSKSVGSAMRPELALIAVSKAEAPLSTSAGAE